MKLTRRQEKFIQKMIELKHEFACPIHYSLLAKRLGVSPFTAYDMLCLLEEKGYVSSEYRLPADKSGPGRAERLFYLSEVVLAHHQKLFDRVSQEHMDEHTIEASTLEKLHQGEAAEAELTRQTLARLQPNGQDEIGYCVEVMTIAALSLKHDPAHSILLLHLPGLLPGDSSPGDPSPGESESTRANLGLLGGFVYSLLVQQSANPPEWLELLRQHFQRYTDLVMGLSAKDCTRLAGHLRGVFTSLAEARG
jgi:Mn-dependent DtxR family transcriptional regulator